ncbi:MAG: hypothetical protein HC898_10820 [Phycisphaerales bacterium]|nr:hypothetical protein [Phycisphaerales bacterium]
MLSKLIAQPIGDFLRFGKHQKPRCTPVQTLNNHRLVAFSAALQIATNGFDDGTGTGHIIVLILRDGERPGGLVHDQQMLIFVNQPKG